MAQGRLLLKEAMRRENEGKKKGREYASLGYSAVQKNTSRRRNHVRTLSEVFRRSVARRRKRTYATDRFSRWSPILRSSEK